MATTDSAWAVIRTGGKQYKIAEGDVIEVEKLEAKEDKVTFEDVLASVKGGKVQIGTPTLKVKVTGKLLENFKDKKVRIVKFKSKSKYMRTYGHRQQKSKVQIENITI